MYALSLILSFGKEVNGAEAVGLGDAAGLVEGDDKIVWQVIRDVFKGRESVLQLKDVGVRVGVVKQRGDGQQSGISKNGFAGAEFCDHLASGRDGALIFGFEFLEAGGLDGGQGTLRLGGAVLEFGKLGLVISNYMRKSGLESEEPFHEIISR